MVLELKDLENRIYDGKKCVGFDYIPRDEKNKQQLEARFRLGAQDNEWKITVIIEAAETAMILNNGVYRFRYNMPRANLPIMLIAATGLRCFQAILKREIQIKSDCDFMIGEITRDM